MHTVASHTVFNLEYPFFYTISQSMPQSVFFFSFFFFWMIKTAVQLLIPFIFPALCFWVEAERQQADNGRFTPHLVGQAKLFVFGKPTALHPLTQMKIAWQDHLKAWATLNLQEMGSRRRQIVWVGGRKNALPLIRPDNKKKPGGVTFSYGHRLSFIR